MRQNTARRSPWGAYFFGYFPRNRRYRGVRSTRKQWQEKRVIGRRSKKTRRHGKGLVAASPPQRHSQAVARASPPCSSRDQKPARRTPAGATRSDPGNDRRQEDDATTRLQDQRVHRVSGPRRRPDRGDRGAGGRRLQARAVRHQLRQGQDDAAGSDREDRGRRHAQARRRRRWSSGRSRRSRAAPGSSAPCGRAAPRNTRPRSIRATSSRSPRSCATCSAPRPQPEQSYSERQLYEAALDRLSREISAVQRITETEAIKEIEAALAKGPRRGRSPAPRTRRSSRKRRPDPAIPLQNQRPGRFGRAFLHVRVASGE